LQPPLGEERCMSPLYLEKVGLFAPGLLGWANSLAQLRGELPFEPSPPPRYKPLLLPANERRRATKSVRITFGACEDAIGDRLDEAQNLAGVFASSGGDYGVHDQICRALLREDIAVSPTQFHNSVHNAAAGYWSIASGSTQPSISLSAFDFTVAAGCLEAFPLVQTEQLPTLLVFSDCEVVGPIHQKRAIDWPFACAWWLTPTQGENTLAALSLALVDSSLPAPVCANAKMETLRNNNPAARVLPLLEALAKGENGVFHFPTAGGQTVSLQMGCVT
jgi:hypothetical protein